MEFYSYMQLLHAVLYKSPSALQQALTLVGIHSLSSNENRVSAPKEILLCDRSIFIPKIGFIFVSLPPGPKIKYRVSHFHGGLALVSVFNCGGNYKTNCLNIAKRKSSYIIPYIYKTGSTLESLEWGNRLPFLLHIFASQNMIY